MGADLRSAPDLGRTPGHLTRSSSLLLCSVPASQRSICESAGIVPRQCVWLIRSPQCAVVRNSSLITGGCFLSGVRSPAISSVGPLIRTTNPLFVRWAALPVQVRRFTCGIEDSAGE